MQLLKNLSYIILWFILVDLGGYISEILFYMKIVTVIVIRLDLYLTDDLQIVYFI